MLMLDGRPLAPDAPFTYRDTQYPANWVRLASPAEREALGITEIIVQPRPDERFYWVSEDPATPGAWLATPKELAPKKAAMVIQVKATAASLLARYDWMVVRATETPAKPVPKDILLYRAAVRSASDAHEAAVQAAADIAALAALPAFEWPADPREPQRG